MNFFEHQDEARRNTNRLVMLFGLAIALMILAFYLIAILTLQWGSGWRTHWWQPQLMGLITIGTLGAIGLGSLRKLVELRQGGGVIAAGLGGRKLTPQTEDEAELRLLNVVAEMALASGTPIPTVYLLDRETGINAFAAGYSADDAVIGVTRGCLDQLSRDELQGVIGHEFSHILNGDMQLNLKLIGVLQGLLMIYIAGREILWHTDDFRLVGRSKDKDSGLNVVLIAGLSLVGIGGIGLLFGRIIKSAVSRQREFLADASAVQFTRNPDGIADALRRIGGYPTGSRITAPKAEEASHLFFGEALPAFSFLGDWFATHPPLEDRIRRINGVAVTPPRTSSAIPLRSPASSSESAVLGFQAAGSTKASHPVTTPAPEAFTSTIGTLSPQNLASAQTFLKSLSPDLASAIRQPESAMALVYAFLLDANPEVRSHQVNILKSPSTSHLADQAIQLAEHLKDIKPHRYLLLLDLAVPALRTLPSQACVEFLQRVNLLIKADQRLTVSEYLLQLILQKRLRPQLQKSVEKPAPMTTLDSLWSDCLTVLSILAKLGHKTAQDAAYAFKSGAYRLPGAKDQEIPNELPIVKLYDLGNSLSRLDSVAPKLKQSIVDACAHTVMADNNVTEQETELLRTIVMMLDCPVPPFLESIRYN